MTTLIHTLSWRFLQKFFCKGKLVPNMGLEGKSLAEEPKAPFIFIGNHAHLLDPFFVGLFVHHPLNFMSNFQSITFKQRLGAFVMGVFPKKKGEPDIAAVKKTLALLKKNRAVGLFIEGDRSWDGETIEIDASAVILAKKAKVPIRIANIKGNYLTQPRWAKGQRKGKVIVTLDTISKEDVLNKSVKELHERVKTFLYRNDVKEAIENGVSFSGENVAEGIEHFIWLCPECGSHDSIRGEADNIVCDKCSFKTKLDANLKIEKNEKAGEDLKDFSDWQKKSVKTIIEKAAEGVITKSEGVEVNILNEDGIEENVGKGTLSLYKDDVVFTSEAKELLKFSVNNIKYFVDNFNRSFTFTCDNKRYLLRFFGKSAYKWIEILRELQK